MTDESIDIHAVKNTHKDDLLAHDNVITVGVSDGEIHVGYSGEEPDLPAELDGIPVVSYHVGDVSPEVPTAAQPGVNADTGLSDRTKRIDPIPGGVSIGHRDITAGTSGFLLTDGYDQYIASNNHVLANVNEGVEGDDILQPGPIHDGESVASLKGGYPPVEDGAVVDLAWARPRQGVDVTHDIVGVGGPYGDIHDPQPGDTLVCSGITTGVSSGDVLQVDASVKVNFGDAGTFVLEEQVLTESMSGPGDSGSPVLHQGHPSGKIFAGSDSVSVLMTASNIEKESGKAIVTKDPPTVAMEDAMWTFRARPDPDSRYKAGVLDGDTYDLVIDQAFRSQTAQRVRSRRLDTAEIWSNSGPEELQQAQEQRDFVRQWVREAIGSYSGDWPLLVRTYQDTGKYGRWLADIYNRDEESLAAAVVDEFGTDYVANEASLEELQHRFDGLAEDL